MTLTPHSLRHNLIELVSAAENQLLIADTEGELLFTATKGMGLVYKISYLLFDNFLDTTSERDHLKKALDNTVKSYQDVVQRLIRFASQFNFFYSERRAHLSQQFCYLSVTIASFHKAVKNPRIIDGINKLCLSVLGINFPLNLEKKSLIDLLRRLLQFEELSQSILPVDELVQANLTHMGIRTYRSFFKNYEKKILTHPLPLDSQESIDERKKRVQKKLIKLLFDLYPYVEESLKNRKPPQRIPEYSLLTIWSNTGCDRLVDYLPNDQKWPSVFEFDDYVFHPKESIQWERGRDWMEITLQESNSLVVILFQNSLKEVYYREYFESTPIIPLNEIAAINPKKGYWLERRFLLRLNPFQNVEKEVVALINNLKNMRSLPIDYRTRRMEPQNFGFTDTLELKAMVPYLMGVYHLFYLQDFLWRLTKNGYLYLRIFKITGLGAALMGDKVTMCFKAHLKQKDKKVREIAASTKTVEEDFKKFWIEPFKEVIDFAKKYPECERKRVFSLYHDKMKGSYPFEGLLYHIISKK